MLRIERMVEMVLFRNRPIRTLRLDEGMEIEFYKILKEMADMRDVDVNTLRDAEEIKDKFTKYGLV